MEQQFTSNGHLMYTVFNTGAGWIGLIASTQGCLSATFPQKTRNLVKIALRLNDAAAIYSPDYFQDWCDEFKSYFAGERVEFSGKIDISKATAFQQAVWTAARNIHYGEIQSYAWIARQIGKPQAPRAVGQALGRNPLPIIVPCHRILASHGGLGGFGGGLEMKQFLLTLEATKRVDSLHSVRE
jgi:methylated-DNA-[protein]-cysteine S-methyltransferase